ncbi:phospholipase A [Pseudogulbenkiania sp. MAI-1]|uniref:phospholipase A n=1 Tax=Pseudogulbenkiania sp. MAI-1 TaxID=990370 RepID=UPI00045E9836|nr:phospholipase A [Pseudogulbenkiania sp. MAI-1]
MLFSRCLLGLPLMLPLLCSAETAAETADAALGRCAKLAQAQARLACFDAAAAALHPAVPVTSASEAAVPAPAEAAAETPAAAAAEPVAGPAPQETAAEALPTHTSLAQLWDLDDDSPRGVFMLRGHRPSYFLPGWHQAHPNYAPSSPTQGAATQDLRHTEAKFQLSFKSKIWQNMLGTPADLWFGYTQQSHWQLYNKHQSSPFRETDYEPEIMASVPVDWSWLGWRVRLLGTGFVHQSNGQSDPLSRSWNRVYGMVGVERGPLTLTARLWQRLPETEGSDDNPDITDYYGHGDLQALYRWNNHTLGTLVRYNPSTGKGALQLGWTFPLSGRLRGYLQYFDGYGESLIDYNHRNQGIGFGLLLNDWTQN